MSDTTTTIAELRALLREFVAARRWERHHTPKNLAMSIAIEAAELMEHFQWCSGAESRRLVEDEEARAEIAEELADVLIYALHFANVCGIDVSSAVRAKVARNEKRFPPGWEPPSTG
ncbi:hypothetical protein ARMA_2546 [Ardenticatena maritima]|uniref:Nucleotide pyrophosphohydrolase n=1 Tax=Ardenticatena maritima TaxID=872965 RepID=A0A0M8K8R4_9CHLR|nr:nucleotide pyrophosphohydrolase [Ardenticatena maritima]KPL86437.1 hypothetical protein SE16_14175 [Ardenticatena maritima]GAP64123.1 hypothetical protein ARMA_2546 [Ardenticatena maritima]